MRGASSDRVRRGKLGSMEEKLRHLIIRKKTRVGDKFYKIYMVKMPIFFVVFTKSRNCMCVENECYSGYYNTMRGKGIRQRTELTF